MEQKCLKNCVPCENDERFDFINMDRFDFNVHNLKAIMGHSRGL